MLFWFIAALLTLAASLAVLMPLARRGGGMAGAGSHDLEVYRDQLAEVERDAARGLISSGDAEQARTEIGRRILRLRPEGSASGAVRPRLSRAAGAVAVLAVPLVSWSVYGAVGSPDMPGQPLAARMAKNPADSTMEELVMRAEAHLSANPSDGRGWDVLAPIYVRMGRFAEAATAYRNAIRLEGATAAREAGLGEAIASEAGGMVSADAQAALERALQLDPGFPKARFLIAVGLAQEGRLQEAAGRWQAMLAILPAQSPWRTAAEQSLAEVQARLAAAGSPGPRPDDIEAAAGLAPADRAAMIEAMVAGLDERLRGNPADAEGWKRLVRSYMVLGRIAEARGARDRGVVALGPDSPAGRGIAEYAASLGLAASE